MSKTQPRCSPDDLARLGVEVFDQKVRPTLRAEDDGKFIAIDVVSGEFELEGNDHTAVMRLRARRPTAEIWLMRAGLGATCRIGRYP